MHTFVFHQNTVGTARTGSITACSVTGKTYTLIPRKYIDGAQAYIAKVSERGFWNHKTCIGL